MQEFYRCEERFEARAEEEATKACKKLVMDMHYGAHIQAIVNYHRSIPGEKVTKVDARTMTLTREQYIQQIQNINIESF
jgi:hypothetical protein